MIYLTLQSVKSVCYDNRKASVRTEQLPRPAINTSSRCLCTTKTTRWMLTYTILTREFISCVLLSSTLTIESWICSPPLPLTTFEDDTTFEHQTLLSSACAVHSELEKYGSIKFLEPWFPRINPDHPRSKKWRTWTAQRQVVLWGCFLAVSFICIINFSLATWAWVHFGTTSDGVVELYQGDCATIKRAVTWAHVVINVLGTVLLGASNLTLQLLVAPTRKEVDAAHAKGTWLDIGVPSLRNLRHIGRLRAMLWGLLAITSIPIIFL